MKDIWKMLKGVIKRLAQSYRTLVIERSKKLNIASGVLLNAFALFCYPLVLIVLVVILLIVVFITVPVSFFTKHTITPPVPRG